MTRAFVLPVGVGRALVAAMTLVLTAIAGAAAAQVPAEPAPPAPTSGGTEVGVLVDTYFAYQFNGAAGDALLRNFDTRNRQFALSMAELWLSSAATPDRRVGFAVKFNFGSAASMINAYEPGSAPGLQNVQQVYASYLAPVGKGLQVDVGKFATPLGAEVIEAKDNWNYSRSLLFALAIPYYHVGARVGYSPSDRLTLTGYIVNGWNNAVDNNTGQSLGVQVAYRPTPALSLVGNYLAGPEHSDQTNDWRHVVDATATWTVSPTVSLMANYDYGREAASGGPVRWSGVAGYARFQVTPRFALTPRVEWYDDPQGATTGLAQTVKEMTVTAECKARDNFLLRAEFRRDWSSQPFFPVDTGSPVPHQSSLAVAMLYNFARIW
jgi:hypothetical protein